MASNLQAAALLIIDMQKGSFTDTTPRFDEQGVVERINKLAEVFRSQHRPVIVIQHDGTAQGAFLPNTEEWELLDSLRVSAEDISLSKTANDSFYRSDLSKILDEHGTREVMITGCATDFCVESTVQSALAKDYNVTVVADSHTTADRPALSAKQVIDHYNWLWREMIPTGGEIRVLAAADIAEFGRQKTL